ncbi:hypothetical protein [Paenibacillus camelliae]|uniref:hypothetical protein n=1 Tax=Paenibacillus camelliae TaxID=512410 RepID=UPI0020426C10|nr:hypothetical protein [Paenibacillus camelliae]MCM3634468.1 hypothetical protein [Paenibacillus camelliae]
MRILGYMILGMVIVYMSLFLGEMGLILMGGAVFGLLLYIAIMLSDNSKKE